MKLNVINQSATVQPMCIPTTRTIAICLKSFGLIVTAICLKSFGLTSSIVLLLYYLCLVSILVQPIVLRNYSHDYHTT